MNPESKPGLKQKNEHKLNTDKSLDYGDLRIARPPRIANGVVYHQTVTEHLLETGAIASYIHPLAQIAGKWHDLGKFDPEWQDYIRAIIAGLKRKSPGHAIHGAALAWKKRLYPIAFAILGHHAGLHNLKGADGIKQKLKDSKHWESICAIALEELGEEFFEHPSYIPDEPIKEELLTRIIFSALIDADRESAARFLEDWEEVERPPLETLLNRFESNYKDLTKGAPDTPANTVRREIYQCCKIAADLDLGFFRLTTPTGGGKTLSVMAFALRHAIRLEKKLGW